MAITCRGRRIGGVQAVRIMAREHDRAWINRPDELGPLIVNADFFVVHAQWLSGHDIRLGGAVRSYRLRVVAPFDD